MISMIAKALSITLSALVISACSVELDEGVEVESIDEQTAPHAGGSALPEIAALFDPRSVVGEPKLVNCTLSEGAETSCLSITLQPEPAAFDIGPWCPRSIEDGPDLSGIWLEGGAVYEADGAFIQNLPEFYNDTSWQMFDPETGKINVTDTEVSCRAAARPDVDPEYQNHCVECQVDYLPEGLYQTYVIPIGPVPASTVSSRVGREGVGIAFGGVRLDAAAPVEAILSAHTLAPFDDCGGHVNPAVGYHIHAVTECLEGVDAEEGHAPQIGLAMDGYGLFAQLDPNEQEASDLDRCKGHESDSLGYHYHVGAPGSNEILGCHRGQTGCVLTSASDVCDASQIERRGPPPRD